MYMGLAYGKKIMRDIDFTICQFTTTAKATDSFICYDGFFDADRMPVMVPAERNDVRNVKTLQANTQTGNFSVQF
jgi:hypothetical protein